jgi:hypothetical protein
MERSSMLMDPENIVKMGILLTVITIKIPMTFSQKQKKKSQNSYDSTKAHEQSKQS